MTTTVVEKFNEINAPAKESFYKMLAVGTSYDECEDLFDYIAENRLAPFSELVEMEHIFYDSDPELISVAYELRASNLLKKLTVYTETTTEQAKEALVACLTPQNPVPNLIVFIQATEDETLIKEVMDLVESNKYLPEETITVLRG